MSGKRKYSKDTEDKINRDLSDSIEHKRETRKKSSTDKKKKTNEKSKKEKSATKKKDTDYVTVELPSKVSSQLIKAAGLPGGTAGLKLQAKISYKVKK